ncbi:MAG: dTMP kinase [Rickettsiales bacterium]|nr:dTMP kinase [Rickettsiales bacterium]
MLNIECLKGKFITFEGGEGAGKSTQSKMFVEYLNKNGIKAEWSREPGGCDEAEEIRSLLVRGSADRWDGVTELLLMYASRRVHTEKKIKPLLKQGITVVSDRYFDSTFAYQGFGYNLPIEKIESVKKVVLEDFKPDLTFFLDLDVQEGLERTDIRGEKNRYEDMKIEFHNRVREGFNYICEKEKDRCIKIDVGNGKDIDTIFSEILNKSIEFFNNK